MVAQHALEHRTSHAHKVRPNPENLAVYDALFEHYLNLYPATKDTQHFLSELHIG